MPKISPSRLWQVTTGLAVLALLLVVVNSFLIVGNEKRQADVNQRQQFINQSVQLSRVSQSLISALAQASVRTDDKEIRDMLASSGFVIQANPAPQAEPGASAPAPAKPAGK